MALDINNVIVSGDLAAVRRLAWTLTMKTSTGDDPDAGIRP